MDFVGFEPTCDHITNEKPIFNSQVLYLSISVIANSGAA